MMRSAAAVFSCSCVFAATAAHAQPVGTPSGEPLDWRALEPPVLRRHVQLTSRDRFLRAGEQYFNADASWVIFQAIPVPPAGVRPDAHYSMYVAKVVYDDTGNPVALDEPILVSPPGSANTCGWFHPLRPWEVMFGSTLVQPAEHSGPGYQRGEGRYVWQFPSEMEVVTRVVPEIWRAMHPGQPQPAWEPKQLAPTPLFERPGYDAECSWSADGRFVLYANVDDEKSARLGKPDADIYVYDTRTGRHTPIVVADGYDGGPFFSPDGEWICYRSDRRGDNELQLFVGELDFDADGAPAGLKREIALSDNAYVNWAPFWHPSMEFIVYATSEVGHHNYEVFAVQFDPDTPLKDLWRVRITHADGFDGLPAFSADGRHVLWVAQRGPLAESEQRPSSQIWAAEFNADALRSLAREHAPGDDRPRTLPGE
ncbi:MAG: hypothetical protein AMXMBFR77_23090 [Phycisphaerales bacterium]|nr:hypothetical protein [Phycisphaerales bacterium]GIK20429.1 MAG: hypothetical protein BroJett004_25930 [Planctomycetota bacterium]